MKSENFTQITTRWHLSYTPPSTLIWPRVLVHVPKIVPNWAFHIMMLTDIELLIFNNIYFFLSALFIRQPGTTSMPETLLGSGEHEGHGSFSLGVYIPVP